MLLAAALFGAADAQEMAPEHTKTLTPENFNDWIKGEVDSGNDETRHGAFVLPRTNALGVLRVRASVCRPHSLRALDCLGRVRLMVSFARPKSPLDTAVEGSC